MEIWKREKWSISNHIFHYTRCITPKHVTTWRGPSQGQFDYSKTMPAAILPAKDSQDRHLDSNKSILTPEKRHSFIYELNIW